MSGIWQQMLQVTGSRNENGVNQNSVAKYKLLPSFVFITTPPIYNY
jgi:hypothetical protein